MNSSNARGMKINARADFHPMSILFLLGCLWGEKCRLGRTPARGRVNPCAEERSGGIAAGKRPAAGVCRFGREHPGAHESHQTNRTAKSGRVAQSPLGSRPALAPGTRQSRKFRSSYVADAGGSVSEAMHAVSRRRI